MDKEKILALAQAKWHETSSKVPMCDHHLHFAEALIESYKAELLKEVGEPVAHVQVTPDGNLILAEITKTAEAQQLDQWDRQMGWTLAKLYTSDQVAAAVLKAEHRVAGATRTVGRHCLSEDDCISNGISFAAYERGVNDAANAIEREYRKFMKEV